MINFNALEHSVLVLKKQFHGFSSIFNAFWTNSVVKLLLSILAHFLSIYFQYLNIYYFRKLLFLFFTYVLEILVTTDFLVASMMMIVFFMFYCFLRNDPYIRKSWFSKLVVLFSQHPFFIFYFFIFLCLNDVPHHLISFVLLIDNGIRRKLSIIDNE
jgi:hypothetical protein